jgi:hypothetical protein
MKGFRSIGLIDTTELRNSAADGVVQWRNHAFQRNRPAKLAITHI